MNGRQLQVFTVISISLALATVVYAANAQAQTGQSSAPVQVASTGSGTQGAGEPSLMQRNPRYQVQKGDVLVLDFPFTAEFNETVTVQPDGYITLRGLSDMHVDGMTTPQMQEALRAAYSKILHDPVVTVTPQSFVSPYFTAFGEVGKPGKYDLHGDTTLTQGIAIAGGLNTAAKHSQVYLFRRVSNDWVSAQKVDVKHMLKSGNLTEDLQLQPGDMIYVPKSTVAKVLSIQPLIPYNTFRMTFGPY